jgi:hypothetical protein
LRQPLQRIADTVLWERIEARAPTTVASALEDKPAMSKART